MPGKAGEIFSHDFFSSSVGSGRMPDSMRMNSQPVTPDRRRAPRFRVALPVEFEGGTGTTRDISICGMFFETDRAFAAAEPITVTVILEYAESGRPVRLECRGQVVRLEQLDGKVGVAVTISAYRFEMPAPDGNS
jgi:PilZ domain